MKRTIALILTLLAALALLAACGGSGSNTSTDPADSSVPGAPSLPGASENEDSGAPVQKDEPPTGEPEDNSSPSLDDPQAPNPALGNAAEPAYSFQAEERREEFRHEDGTLLAYCDYKWQSLLPVNLELLSRADRDAAEETAEAFNSRLLELVESAQSVSEVESYARESYADGYTAGLPYYEEMSAQSTICGHIVSVRQEFYYNTGGAHPNYSTGSLVFDLRSGQFIVPVQVSDDPAAFHAAAAELLIQKADALGQDYVDSYWPDYRDTIGLWDSAAAVLFDETGMTVIFSPYDLGPFSLGSVALHLERQELEALIGPGGMEKLGWTAEPGESST